MEDNRYTQFDTQELCTEIRAIGEAFYSLIYHWNETGMPTDGLAVTIAGNLNDNLNEIARTIVNKQAVK